jgi:hypothetical protein
MISPKSSGCLAAWIVDDFSEIIWLFPHACPEGGT